MKIRICYLFVFWKLSIFMSKLIFDIETYGYSGDKLDPVIAKSLTKRAETEEEKQKILDRTGLYPVSGEIVAIAVLNPESKQGKVYFQAPEEKALDYEKDSVQYMVKTEKEILEQFWQDVKFYQQLISYNGRGFDCPFIIFRSMVHGIKPTRNLMPYRYGTKEHLDLMDQLAFYGAFRKFSLEVMCQLLGVKNPKDEGVSGLAVNELFENKEYKKIAEYCMRDVVATAELYERVKDYIY